MPFVVIASLVINPFFLEFLEFLKLMNGLKITRWLVHLSSPLELSINKEKSSKV